MARPGNPDNLRAAARRKRAAATERAEKAINALVRDGAPVNFRAVARVAGCSPDFLYRTPALRRRIESLRDKPARAKAAPPDELERSPSNVVRELAAQLADERRRRREEVAALEAALAAAHGELLELRRGHAASAAPAA
jgi:Family of unknown function (DUF6262)